MRAAPFRSPFLSPFRPQFRSQCRSQCRFKRPRPQRLPGTSTAARAARAARVMAVLVAGLCAAGCGQRGPLYLPASTILPPAPTTLPVPPAPLFPVPGITSDPAPLPPPELAAPINNYPASTTTTERPPGSAPVGSDDQLP